MRLKRGILSLPPVKWVRIFVIVSLLSMLFLPGPVLLEGLLGGHVPGKAIGQVGLCLILAVPYLVVLFLLAGERTAKFGVAAALGLGSLSLPAILTLQWMASQRGMGHGFRLLLMLQQHLIPTVPHGLLFIAAFNAWRAARLPAWWQVLFISLLTALGAIGVITVVYWLTGGTEFLILW